MLGQPSSMLIPEVVGFRLHGKLQRRRHRHGPGADGHGNAAQEGRGRKIRGVLRLGAFQLERSGSRHDRQHGAGIWRDHGLFPRRRGNAGVPAIHRAHSGTDRAGRSVLQRADRCSARTRRRIRCSATRWNLILAALSRRSLGRSGRRIASRCARRRLLSRKWSKARQTSTSPVKNNGDSFDLSSGAVVIAAITSCTNTSNPSLMLGAGLLAKKAVERGLQSQAVGEDQSRAGIESGDGLSCRPPGSQCISIQLKFQSGRLRLHHLHRQQRAAAGGDRRGHQGQQSGGGRGAQRQSQF